MSARIAGYILILQSEKNHDSVERLNLADRITEVEKANNLYLDLDTQRGIVKEQKGLSMRIRKNVKLKSFFVQSGGVGLWEITFAM